MPVNTRAQSGEVFELWLPMVSSTPPTHVVELIGQRREFYDVLELSVRYDLVLASALHGPVGLVSVGELADRLNAVGFASVRSIDLLDDPSQG